MFTDYWDNSFSQFVHMLILVEEFFMYRMYRMIVEMYSAIFLPSNCIYTVEVTYIKTNVLQSISTSLTLEIARLNLYNSRLSMIDPGNSGDATNLVLAIPST